jgi:mutator family transposase
MTETLSAERSERAEERRGYRSGSYSRSLITRVGTIELRVPRDRSGLFSTELFERYQRSEKALVSALAEMYVQDVSTRKVQAVTETLCGHSFSASAISGMNQTLDAALTALATRRLEAAYPYLILDARYERVRGWRRRAHHARTRAVAQAIRRVGVELLPAVFDLRHPGGLRRQPPLDAPDHPAAGLVWALVQFPMVGTVSFATLLICRVLLGAGEGPAGSVGLRRRDRRAVADVAVRGSPTHLPAPDGRRSDRRNARRLTARQASAIWGAATLSP